MFGSHERVGAAVCLGFLALILLVPPSAGGIIELTEEPYTDYCGALDLPGMKTIYVQHYAVGGFTGCRFRIQPDLGNTMTYISEVVHVPGVVGDTQNGITFCYSTCSIGPRILLTSITYMQYGTSENCSRLLVIPHPAAETVEEMNCNFRPEAAYVQDFTLVAAGSACGCSDPHAFPGVPEAFGCAPLAAEQSTWGRIKALYR